VSTRARTGLIWLLQGRPVVALSPTTRTSRDVRSMSAKGRKGRLFTQRGEQIGAASVDATDAGLEQGIPPETRKRQHCWRAA
jgi:hypothetical protein